MAFSFNPGQISPASAPGQVDQAQQPVAVSQGDPKSPIYFLRDKGKPFSIPMGLQIILIVINICAVGICIVLFTYSFYLTARIEEHKEKVLAQEAQFKTYPFDDMRRLSKRLTSVGKLLNEYIAVESPLKYLERIVENEVYFDKFSFGNDKGVNFVSFEAYSTNYKSLIQQLDALNLNNYTRVAPTPKFTNFTDQDRSIKVAVRSNIVVAGKLPIEVDGLFDLVSTSTIITSTSSAGRAN